MLGLQIRDPAVTTDVHSYTSSQCLTRSNSPSHFPHLAYAYRKTLHQSQAWRSKPSFNVPKGILIPYGRKTMRSPRAKSKMPFLSAPAQLEDIPRLVEIEFAAFREETVNQKLSYRDDKNPNHFRRTIQAYKKYMLSTTISEQGDVSPKLQRIDSEHEAMPQSTYDFRKVVDSNTGEIIAFSKTWTGTLTPDDLRKPLDIGYEGEPEVNRKWMALNEGLHRKYVGLKHHCYFGMLATHPDYQEQGAATMLMNELVAAADSVGVEMYCEATARGRPLYEKYGFVPIFDIVFDATEYGVSNIGIERQTVMVRGALGQDGRRCAVRSLEDCCCRSEG